jgi:Na+-transporting NADH:ubiquinone oxidoreductase subunit NqrC
VELSLQEIVRSANVPSGTAGNTAIRFNLMKLAMLVENNIENLIVDLQEKRRSKAAREQEKENAARTSEQRKRKQADDQDVERRERAENRSKRRAVGK